MRGTHIALQIRSTAVSWRNRHCAVQAKICLYSSQKLQYTLIANKDLRRFQSSIRFKSYKSIEFISVFV